MVWDDGAENEMLNFLQEQMFKGKDMEGTRVPEGQSGETPKALGNKSISRSPRWSK